MKKPQLWLGIDTSCDDTSVAVIEVGDGTPSVVSNIISSQDDIHKEWGGVVPMLAKRAHEERFDRVLELALQRAKVSPEQLTGFSVTYGPGLAPALEVGVARAKQLAQEWQIPLVPVNHVEGHMLSACLSSKNGRGGIELSNVRWPILTLVVSGGHTELVLVHGVGRYELLGETVDDAFGEAFDKVARLLNLGYPGGGLLALLAEQGNPRAFLLPRAMRQSGDLNVSYSGLKTAMQRLVRDLTTNPGTLTPDEIRDMAASFQAAAVETLTYKVAKALEQHPEISALWLGGGAAANLALRRELRGLSQSRGVAFHTPYTNKLCRDNGAMIALVGWLRWQQSGGQDLPAPESIERVPQLRVA